MRQQSSRPRPLLNAHLLHHPGLAFVQVREFVVNGLRTFPEDALEVPELSLVLVDALDDVRQLFLQVVGFLCKWPS